MKRKYLILLALVVALLSAAPVLASDISDADFVAGILVKNLSGATATEEVTVFTLDTQDLIDNHYILEDASNTAIRNSTGADVPYMPAVSGTDKWCVWVPQIAGSTQLNYQLYTGGGDMESVIRYFPAAGGMTTLDDATLEPGDDFEFEISGYLDTAAGYPSYAAYKDDAFWLHTGCNFTTPYTYTDGGETWAGETNAFDGDLGTQATEANIAGTSWGEYLEFSFDSTDIEHVAFKVNHSVDVDQIDLDAYYSAAWHDYYQGAPTWNDWTYKSGAVDGVTAIRIRFYNNGAGLGTGYIHEVKLVTEGNGLVSALANTKEVNASGVSAGENTVKVSTDSSMLTFDGTSDYISLGAAAYDSLTDCTIEIAYKPNIDLDAQEEFRVVNQFYKDSENYFMLCYDHDSDAISFKAVSSDVTIISIDAGDDAGESQEWHTARIVFGDNGAGLWIDGVFQGSDESTECLDDIAPTTSNYIGGTDDISGEGGGGGEGIILGFFPEWAHADVDLVDWSLMDVTVYFAVSVSSIDPMELYLWRESIVDDVLDNVHTAGKKCVVSLRSSSGQESVIENATNRANLIDALSDLIDTWGFDGLEIDWEHDVDEDSLADFIEEVYAELHPSGLLLGSVGSYHYDLLVESDPYLDWIDIMCYDLWKGVGYPYHSTLEESQELMEGWVTAGFTKSKLLMGIPFYAREAGTDTWQYQEIVDEIDPTPDTNYYDAEVFLGKTVDGGRLWWNGLDLVKEKVAWAKSEGYGGIMCFEIGSDTHGTEDSLLQAIKDQWGSTKYEYYDSGDSSYDAIAGVGWRAQTFTPEIAHEITSVRLYCYRTGSPGTITVSIRATSGDVPTGEDLCSGTTDGDTLPTSSPYEWREIQFSSPAELSSGVKYAVVVRAPDGDGSNYLKLRVDTTGEYAGGNVAKSYNSGSTWPDQEADWDYLFEELGITGGSGEYLPWSGNIAETKLWNNASSSLVGYWKIREGTGQIAHDSSTTGKNGVITGCSWSDSNDFLSIYVNDTEEGCNLLYSITVPGNENDWITAADGVIPYMEYQKITVSDVLRQEIYWENDTTFHDLSGNGNDATPSLRDTATNADITAELYNYRPVTEAEFTGSIEAETADFIGSAPDEPPEMYTEGTINLPGAEVINTLLDAGGIPQSLFWFPALFLSIIFLLFVVYAFTHSLMGAVITGGALMGFFGIMGAIPLWTIIIYAIISGSLVLKRESIGL